MVYAIVGALIGFSSLSTLLNGSEIVPGITVIGLALCIVALMKDYKKPASQQNDETPAGDQTNEASPPENDKPPPPLPKNAEAPPSDKQSDTAKGIYIIAWIGLALNAGALILLYGGNILISYLR